MAKADPIDSELEYIQNGLEKIRTKLLDQTRRNRLLNYKELSRDVGIVDEMPNQVFKALVLDGGRFRFGYQKDGSEDVARVLPTPAIQGDEVDPRHRDQVLQTPFSKKELESRLTKLYREHNTFIEETGANCLYLATGFLEWFEPEQDEARPFRSPLMLIPVRLARKRTYGEVTFELSSVDGALDTNYSLAERLYHDFQITFPELKDEEPPENYWGRVQETIAARRQDGWNVVREMALGLFSFHKQIMWHDLDPDRWPKHANIVDKPVFRTILLGPQPNDTAPGQLTDETVVDPAHDTDAERLRLVRDADSSQCAALIDALERKDGLVIEGPPGTGKSQTITNLIAAALDRGLTVLFVAEKMAALDVVFKRLDECGLGDYCLQLHGLKSDKKALLQSVIKRVETAVESPERLSRETESLKKLKEQLLEVSSVLQKPVGPEGLALHDVIWRVERLNGVLPDNFDEVYWKDPDEVQYEEFDSARSLITVSARERQSTPERARKAWVGFVPDSFRESERTRLLESFQVGIDESERTTSWLEENGALEECDSLFEVWRLLRIGDANPRDTLPELPIGPAREVLIHAIRHRRVGTLAEESARIRRYLDTVKKANTALDYSSTSAEANANQLKTHAERLADVACSKNTRLNRIKSERDVLARVVDVLDSIVEKTSDLTALVQGNVRTLNDAQNAVQHALRLSTGPASLSLYAKPLHSRATAKNYVQNAYDAAQALQAKAEALKPRFKLERVCETEEIEVTYRTLQDAVGSWFPILRKDYRLAKGRVRGFLVDRANFKSDPNFIDELRNLLRFCTERDQFRANEDFQNHLGPAFKGLDTDWNDLGSLVKFSHQLRKHYGAEAAERILMSWDDHVERMGVVAEWLQRSLQLIEKFRSTHPYPDSLWDRPIVEIANTLRPWIDKLSAAAEVFDQAWCSTQPTLLEAIKAVEAFKSARSMEEEIENSEHFDSIVRPIWQRASTKSEQFQEIQDWIQDRLKVPGVNEEILRWIFLTDEGAPRSVFEKLAHRARNLRDEIHVHRNVLSEFGQVDLEDWIGGKSATTGDYAQKLRDCGETIYCLPVMQRWQNLKEQSEKAGLAGFTQKILDGTLDQNNASAAFEFSFYTSLLEKHINDNSVLRDFSHVSYEDLRERFAKLDQKLFKLNADAIAANVHRVEVPQGTGRGPVKKYSEYRLLQHEAGKKTRHIPIRQLVSRSKNALQALKPCFLMSPLSVSQYLPPGEIEFDLVVMDEASQLRPEDALGAIARARKAVIVGDPKQLPPTKFFDSVVVEDEEQEETIADDAESILDVCLKQLPFRRLRWHYRSQHESLIQFSNDQFYDGDLIVFPSPVSGSRDLGVFSNFVSDSSYRKGRNHNEAAVVVENIKRHFQRNQARSLGVVALNKKQAEEIQDLLQRELDADRTLERKLTDSGGLEPLFIKNLENVQGDERDVVFISTTYGPSREDGRVYQRFGPINSDLGWRRLNVVATRARQRVEVFTSLKPSDIIIGPHSKRGARALRNYLEYAATGRLPDTAMPAGGAYENEFEESVGRMIEALGFQCVPQVGVAGFYIDLGVIHPNRPGQYLLGVECDGARYHSSKFVRDRDRLRQEILEEKGWRLHRIWSTSWYHTRAAEIARLEESLQKCLNEIEALSTAAAEGESSETIVEVSGSESATLAENDSSVNSRMTESLNRYWDQNIRPQHPDRTRSVLSLEAVECLIRAKPTTKEEWFAAVPLRIREKTRPEELEFLEDIYSLIADHE